MGGAEGDEKPVAYRGITMTSCQFNEITILGLQRRHTISNMDRENQLQYLQRLQLRAGLVILVYYSSGRGRWYSSN